METKDITYRSLPVLDVGHKKFANYHEMVDFIEQQSVEKLPQMDLPLVHRVTPGLYSREMFAPANTFITSEIHAVEHQFFVLQGKILVIDESGSRVISAPFTGISPKGARRIGFVLEDVIWTTVHSTPLAEDKKYTKEEFLHLIKEIHDEVIEPRTNNLLTIKE